MRSPALRELPPPPPGRGGWPWTEESAPLPPEPPGGGAWPRISIVVPNYDYGAYLEETIRSVLLQGYPALELIVVDGGSPDGSVEVIRRYERWLAFWVSEPDRGQADAINKGLSRCTGEVVAYLNSDDRYRPGALARVGAAFAADGRVRWLSGGCANVDGRGTVLDTFIPKPELTPCEHVAGTRLHQPSVFWRRELVARHGVFDDSLHYTFDHEYWARLACAGEAVRVIEGTLADFRVHDQSKTGTSVNPGFLRENVVVTRRYLDRFRGAERSALRAEIRRLERFQLLHAFTRARGGGRIPALARLAAGLARRPDLLADYFRRRIRGRGVSPTREPPRT